MKLFLALSTLALAFVASAALANGGTLSVKINSFTNVAQGTNGASSLGEVCGTVTGAAAGALVPVSVTSDPGTSNPGIYTVLADQSGNFCVVINTYSGTASAQVWLPGSTSSSASAAQSQAHR